MEQAVAARLPQITLTANIGNSADNISNLLMPGTNFWSLAGGLAAPVFDGGPLLHKQRAAEAGFDLASVQYRSTVPTAFQTVADALHALQADADALTAAVAAERAAGRTLAIVKAGLVPGAPRLRYRLVNQPEPSGSKDARRIQRHFGSSQVKTHPSPTMWARRGAAVR
ncbi:MAG: TolC family protein [Rhodopila sp.]|nr:TolC family protein [Rhodopila sp.]